MSRHPGAVLHDDFLRPLGLNANRLATGIGAHRSTVGRVLAGEQRVTPEFAARLAAFFGVPARWWLLMQAEYDAATVLLDAETIADITPLEVPPDVLLTPTGVLRLKSPGDSVSRATRPVSLVVSGEEKGSGAGAQQQQQRRVREVRFDNGAVALVGESS